MSSEGIEAPIRGSCPLCAALILRSGGMDGAGILICPECLTMLAVDRLEGKHLILSEAPQIEEDWGEYI